MSEENCIPLPNGNYWLPSNPEDEYGRWQYLPYAGRWHVLVNIAGGKITNIMGYYSKSFNKNINYLDEFEEEITQNWKNIFGDSIVELLLSANNDKIIKDLWKDELVVEI